MYRIAIAAACLLLFAAPALADDVADAKLAGYKLGKLFVNCQLLAMELQTVYELDQVLAGTEFPGEDEREATVLFVMQYLSARLESTVLPVCDAGLDPDAFSHPVLAEVRAPLQQVLGDVITAGEAFLADKDEAALSAFAQEVAAAGWVDLLVEKAEWAQADSGEEPLE